MAAAVVRGRERAESLLARGVPDRQLHRAAADGHRLDLEVYADGRGQVLLESVVREAKKDRGLPDPGVADEQDLEDVVVVPRERGHCRRALNPPCCVGGRLQLVEL
eukprot:scaffold3709_cov68-Phaeocystis_antarctica.AAC.2